MQFSIQRPSLPSTEAHPEEKLYRRLDVSIWLRHLNLSGRVEEEYKLRKVGSRGGSSPPLRAVVGLPKAILMGVFFSSSASAPLRVELGQYSPLTHLSCASLTLAKVCIVHK